MTARFSGDVAFSVEDGSGPVGGRLQASGDRIRITTHQPGRLWSVAGDLLAALPPGALPASVPTGRAGLRELADVLAAEGMTVEVHGPAGPLVTIGADVDSRLGGLTVGSRRVEPTLPAALSGHPHALGRTAAVGIVALAAFVAGFAARARLRHRPG
ncbi:MULTISPECIES: hypothetical protein [Frankia]|uniref:Uncharacterized protein n=1 Tax=Frankia alni (strain DSM 45986 / CECT 9034 / ACN14a) TaxID=326424 RepID=Q0REV3_FRAAA|nr:MULTISPECIES: hypothetical protein [Frankia]CAJ64001.1 hypothetical protein FRAAL5368 [Frankia alni ACN14a]